MTTAKADRAWVVGWDDTTWQQDTNQSTKGRKNAIAASRTISEFTGRFREEAKQSNRLLVRNQDFVFCKKTDFSNRAIYLLRRTCKWEIVGNRKTEFSENPILRGHSEIFRRAGRSITLKTLMPIV
jgi:hypothetical protein